jgi:universal stress protein A
MSVYRRILLAVDLSTDSLRIGQRARELASTLGAELEILHVIEPLPLEAPIPPEPVVADLVTTQATLIQVAQQRIAPLARELGVPDTRWSIVDGHIKTEIIRAAAEHEVDLIVIGSRERHGLAFFVKPTEDAVLHRAPCDVLAVRLPES